MIKGGNSVTQFENLPTVSTGRKFYLSWSHYLKLMRIDNVDERHFYEIESVKNDWSLSELKRQYDIHFMSDLPLVQIRRRFIAWHLKDRWLRQGKAA